MVTERRCLINDRFFPFETRSEIRARYLALLVADKSPLLGNSGVHAELLGQLDSVLDALAPMLAWRVQRSTGLGLSAQIGSARARSGVSPAQSLKAASFIFEAALPAVTSRLVQLGKQDAPTRAALALNTAILDRMAAAAVSYVDVLLSMSQSNARAERLGMSRELHDVVAPAIALGLQAVDLHDAYLAESPALAEDKLKDARGCLLEALTLVRQLQASFGRTLQAPDSWRVFVAASTLWDWRRQFHFGLWGADV